MTRPIPHLAKLEFAEDRGIEEQPAQSRPVSRLSPDELKRWAEMVARAEAPFPEDCHDDDRALLLNEVQRRRRSRLAQFVARTIAQDILRSRGHQHGETPSC